LPFALVESGTHGIVVTAVNGSAAAAGVVPGQSLADARAALPSLRTKTAERERDRAALEELARWAGRYGPSRNVEADDGFWIDITGVAHLFGGETALLADLRQRLLAAGFVCRLGLADTAAAASALARFSLDASSIAIAPENSLKNALQDLPVEALRLTAQTVLLLKRLGLYRIGQLYGLPRASLARRFRDVGGRDRAGNTGNRSELADAVVMRLDQALGLLREPRRPLLPLPCRVARQSFAEPLVTSTGIEAAIAAITAALCATLEEAGEGARQLRLMLYRTDGTCAVIEIGTSSPSRDEAHLRGLLLEKATSIDLGFGVDAISLDALMVDHLTGSQAALGAKPARSGAQGLAQLIDRLTNRVGASSIYRIQARQSHIPEQADVRLPVFAPVETAPALSAAPKPERPPFLLGRPEPITVVAEVPEGPPRQFLWRRAGHRIVKAEGPERIAPAWWQSIGSTLGASTSRPRDYYRIEDDRGGRYWVFREGFYGGDSDDRPPGWFVHGLFG
jgi:protein ImuB